MSGKVPDFNDKVFTGIRDANDSYTLSIETSMYRFISNQFGDKVFDCPNLYPVHYPGTTDKPDGRYQKNPAIAPSSYSRVLTTPSALVTTTRRSFPLG